MQKISMLPGAYQLKNHSCCNASVCFLIISEVYTCV